MKRLIFTAVLLLALPFMCHAAGRSVRVTYNDVEETCLTSDQYGILWVEPESSEVAIKYYRYDTGIVDTIWSGASTSCPILENGKIAWISGFSDLATYYYYSNGAISSFYKFDYLLMAVPQVDPSSNVFYTRCGGPYLTDYYSDNPTGKTGNISIIDSGIAYLDMTCERLCPHEVCTADQLLLVDQYWVVKKWQNGQMSYQKLANVPQLYLTNDMYTSYDILQAQYVDGVVKMLYVDEYGYNQNTSNLKFWDGNAEHLLASDDLLYPTRYGFDKYHFTGYADFRSDNIGWNVLLPNQECESLIPLYNGNATQIRYWHNGSITTLPYGQNPSSEDGDCDYKRVYDIDNGKVVGKDSSGFYVFDDNSYTRVSEIADDLVSSGSFGGEIDINNGVFVTSALQRSQDNNSVYTSTAIEVFYRNIANQSSYNQYVMYADRNPVSPGSTAIITIDPPPPFPLEWSTANKYGDADADIAGANRHAVLNNVSGTGWLTITATSPFDPQFFLKGMLEVGCSTCTTGVCAIPGAGKVKISSVDVTISLGVDNGGRNAGSLLLKADSVSPALSTPSLLELATLGGVHAVKDVMGDIAQIVAPSAFVDVEVVDEYKYTISIYDPAARGVAVDGRYSVKSGFTPKSVWTIENPDRSATVYNRLNISEQRGTTAKEYQYTWDQTASEWSLSKGGGVQLETKTITVTAGVRTEREKLKDMEGVVASDVASDYMEIVGNGVAKEKLVKSTVYTGIESLETTYTYYEDPSCTTGNCGKLATRTNPDGSWTSYEYDQFGRVVKEKSSFQDSVSGAQDGAIRYKEFSYEPVSVDDTQDPELINSPRKITEYALGNIVGKTFNVYINDDSSRTEIEERAISANSEFGNATNLRTTTRSAVYDAYFGNPIQVESVTYPDGRKDYYSYDYGTYTPGNSGAPGTFSLGGTEIRKTIKHFTASSANGISGKTTIEKTITDSYGVVLQEETWLSTSGGEALISWNAYFHDSEGHVTGTAGSDGTSSQATWDCCGKDDETDRFGIYTDYTRNALGWVKSEVRATHSGDLISTITRDGSGRVLSTIKTGGELNESEGRTYDLAGRTATSTSSTGHITTYDYSNGGRTTIFIRSGEITEVTDRYLDGRAKSLTGTGVVAKWYEYGVDPDGSQWTKVHTGPDGLASQLWEKTTTDMLGRVVKVEKPSPQGIESTNSFYNSKGQLVRTTQLGSSDTIYEYDELGSLVRTGLDVNGSGTLVLASTDRVQDTSESYVQVGSDWWRQSESKVYATDNSAIPTTVSTSRERLTGLGASYQVLGVLTAESVQIDTVGNQTVSRTYIDRATGYETRVVDYPDSDIDGIEISHLGSLVSSQSKTGVETTFGYDGLGRNTTVTDPRTGTATIHYNTLGQIDWRQDAALKTTYYTYEPDTGRLATETDPLGNVKRYVYDALGNVAKVWGSGTYPAQYTYDDFGRKSGMRTWRDDASIDWNAATWPNPAGGDLTQWHYYPDTGLLQSKEDALGRSTIYTYYPGGNLHTRTWARNSITTTYGYHAATGELASITYSDGTPSVSFSSYDRLGRKKTVDDSVGSHTFAYTDPSLQETGETITGMTPASVNHSYTAGRLTGLNLGAGGYSAVYDYDTEGRMNYLGYTVTGKSDSATYGYLANSDLVETLTTTNLRATIYGFEPHRNLKTSVENKYGSTVISRYDYTYDDGGRRATLQVSGKEFKKALNAKAMQPWFQNAQNTGSGIEMLPEGRTYGYDPIGNRKTATGWDETAQASTANAYVPNSLNQYATVNAQALVYDLDGNLTEDQTKRYTYDGENRLVGVEPKAPQANDKKATFAYDYMGRRVKKESYVWQTNAWVKTDEARYVYDGWNMIRELDGNGQIKKSYVWGLALSGTIQGAGGIGGLVASTEGTALTHYYHDGNGNVGQLVDDATSNAVAHYEYDPFGNVSYSHGMLATLNSYRFSTKYHDDETTLVYYGYRYYSPTLGRWVNRDPIGEEGGKNLYALVENKPIDTFDGLGLKDIYYDAFGNETAIVDNGMSHVFKFIEDVNGNVNFCNKKYWVVWWSDGIYLPGKFNGRVNMNWRIPMETFINSQSSLSYVRPWWFIPFIMPNYLGTLDLVLANSPQRKPWDYKRLLMKDEWYVFDGVAYRDDSIGNIAWGAIMKNYGWPESYSRKGAGLYQTYQGMKNGAFDFNTFLSNVNNLGDDPRDSGAITIGYTFK